MKVDVLGSKKDIQNMRMEDLKYFYELNYDPSKLCLVGITGKDTDEIMEWIKDCQKDVESKCDKEISRVFKEEPMEVNRKEFVDTMDISQPFVCVGFKMKPCSNVMESIEKDFAVNMWLDSLMGPLNPKFQEWLDRRIFTQFVGAEADFTIDHSYVLFYAQTINPDAFIELVKEQVKKKTILNDDYQSLRAQAIANNLRGLNHFDGLANDLLRSHFENFDYMDSLNRIQKMSLDKVLSNLGDLDFSNVCVTKILPNDSI